MSKGNDPGDDQTARTPASAVGISDKRGKIFLVSSSILSRSSRVTRVIRRKPSVPRQRDLLGQRRLAVLTLIAGIATLISSIVASTQIGDASIAPRILIGGASPISAANPASVASSPASSASPTSPGSTASVKPRSGFSCSASGSSATTQVSVKGLRSNGSGDDFAAIQNAINAAGRRGGGIVALPAGTFPIDGHLVLKNNVELTGVGPATIIKAGPSFLSTQGPGGGYSLISTAGASNTTIADLTADQNGNRLDGNVPARLTGYVVEGYYSRNLVINGVYVRNPFTYSIAMVRTTDFCVENCNVKVTTSNLYNQLDGIHILDSNTGEVIDNTIRSGDDGLVAHTIGAPVYNILYAGNNVFGGATDGGMQLAVGAFPVYGIEIEDNNFHGSLYGIHVVYYGGSASVFDILISHNYIHNLSQGRRFPAIRIVGSGDSDSIRKVTVIDNRICGTGPIMIQAGPGNVITGTTGC
jgi:hypothetical protein